MEPIIQEKNLSIAWCKAYSAMTSPYKEISPFVVSISDFDDCMPDEDESIRNCLDDALLADKKQTVNTVANTIFPESLWRRCKGDRHLLYERYLDSFPDYVA
ncbi:MAG: hypothetical protein P1V20_04980, partial [Verrucomicrobiales bacterium]|nr:hypothetical protein [Verrucomicrobiales bacterium]